ncbi:MULTISPECIES: polysaccharide biosynthesis/export family protein [Sphingosinicellaceae]|uniref:polysaccharide biosynthesis/export family protein n=1 Tax=Sphingosinicellaceae TaxID=2820280 RepID=UPI001C1E7F3C|nr:MULTISPECIES: polysaccharide biosynthesis/export family protein [Polymorphobacter]QYE34153.1 polysaccharide export protein [Polymorphobacter sp. PAMC 29334]UAJ09332.1 polysaccharide export protein [Polymorphobacter megasporae]
MRRLLLLCLALIAAWLTASAPALAKDAPVVARDNGYVLGPNDTIAVQVYGQPDAGVTTRIKADGTIVMPLIGTVKAEGATQLQLADTIKEKLVKGGYFKDPFVNVEVSAYVSKTVNVAGKVATPGVYPLDKQYTVLEMLLKSGWLREQGASYIYLRRANDSKEIRLETEALVRGSPDKNLILAPGDTLFVPDADTFFVYGQIAHPGSFAITPNMTLREALAIAGGVTSSGSERKVALIRGGGKEVKAAIDEPVRKGDVYIVKERLF